MPFSPSFRSRPVHAQPRTEGRKVMRVTNIAGAGIYLFGAKELVVVPEAPEVGRAVCLPSGGRLAFRRVLAVDGTRLRVRCDVAPFEDVWEGEVIGCVRRRAIDRVAAIDPVLWTSANWRAAQAMAHLLAARSKTRPRRDVRYMTRLLDEAEWPRVRAFWEKTCGKVLAVEAHPQQHVVGLFHGAELVGANIHLVMGRTSYSAFTLVDRSYRGTGGGRKMIEHSSRIAREHGLDSVYVHINSRNLPSIQAYERVGFTHKGWWQDDADPLASAERQWLVLELDLGKPGLSRRQ